MADDDLDDQYLVKKAVEEINLGHVLNTVNNGTQLIDCLLRRGHFQDYDLSRPDCILLDLNMPMMDGFKTLSYLKSHEEIRDIPVFVFSTSRADKDKEKSLQLGAAGFYVKPNRYPQLKEMLSQICSLTAANVAG